MWGTGEALRPLAHYYLHARGDLAPNMGSEGQVLPPQDMGPVLLAVPDGAPDRRPLCAPAGGGKQGRPRPQGEESRGAAACWRRGMSREGRRAGENAGEGNEQCRGGERAGEGRELTLEDCRRAAPAGRSFQARSRGRAAPAGRRSRRGRSSAGVEEQGRARTTSADKGGAAPAWRSSAGGEEQRRRVKLPFGARLRSIGSRVCEQESTGSE